MGSLTPPRRSGLPLFLILAIVVGVLVVVAALTGYFVLRPSGSTGNASGPNPEYPTTFDETGLPSGTSWSVTLDGANHTSSNGSIEIRLPAGTYPYTVAPVPGYVAPKGATVTVAAPSVEVVLAFMAFGFSVTFNETGLPSGTIWSLEIGGSQPATSSDQLTVIEPNGSYPFSVEPPANCTATPSSGTVLVQGRDVSESISFAQNSTLPPPTQSEIVLGGSTSVYPFASLAATWFTQNFSNVVISVNQGGSGAGLLAVCAGQINVAMASIPVTAAALESTYGCPSSYATTITITTVAYDTVDVVVPASNPHGLLSLNFDTLNLIYEHASTTTGYATIATLNGAPLPSGYPAAGSGPLEWGELPAAVAGASVGSLGTEQLESGGAGAGGAPCDAPYADDVCAATFGTTPTPCGWSICAGGNATEPATNVVDAFARSDTSGATQAFEARLMGLTSATTWATNYSGLGWTGCGSTSGYLPDCDITVPDTAIGAPALLAAVASDPNAIGYAPDGLARATSGIGTAGIVPFLADGEGIGNGLAANNSTGLAYGGVVPSLGAQGTLAGAIQNLSTANQYVGWRPFEFVTLTNPTGELQQFYIFVLDPANNLNLAADSYEVSVYSV